jgi:DNA-binding LytR/AlgR family response regulator
VSKGFMRVHRSWIVNPNEVRQVRTDKTIVLRVDCIKVKGTKDTCPLLKQLLKPRPAAAAKKPKKAGMKSSKKSA